MIPPSESEVVPQCAIVTPSNGEETVTYSSVDDNCSLFELESDMYSETLAEEEVVNPHPIICDLCG